jgi:integrase
MTAYRDNTGRWRFRKWVRLPNGQRKRISGTPTQNTKRAAEAEERAAIQRAIDSVLNPHATRKEVPRFQDFAEEVIRNYSEVNHRPSTALIWRTVINKHLVPVFGKSRLHSIGQQMIEQYKRDKLDAELKPNTINIHLRTLHRVLSLAQEWKIIESAPRVTLLRVTEAKFDYLTFEEAEILPATAEMPWKAMIIVGLKTGLRRGELHGLHREDVDLDGGQLIVRRSALRRRLGPTKTGKTRIVAFGRTAHEVLASHLASHRHEVVFCNEDGGLLGESQSRYGLRRACKAAGLRPLGWHALRHTFASHLVMRGAPLKAVQELLGHADMKMTMRYAHLTPGAHRAAVELLDGDDGPAPVAPGEDDKLE